MESQKPKSFGVFSVVYPLVFLLTLLTVLQPARAETNRILSGVIVSDKNEVIPGVSVTARSSSGQETQLSGSDGRFHFSVPDGPVTLVLQGQYTASQEKPIHSGDATENLVIPVQFIIPPVHESVDVVASPLDPVIDRRNNAIYQNTLFSRDDQIFQTLDAGINVGQHEGGGKSVEIRRFGFNLDHGGMSGGLKVLVDNVQQNQASQGHGQGYLGSLKSLTPELIQDVSVTNGPFNAEYGDFSGLGVVHIRLKEALDDPLTVRIQGGSFGTARSFVAYSPALSNADAFVAFEGFRTNGPFQNPLRYTRENVTGNYTRRPDAQRALGVKLNIGVNDFFSSGQIPLDEVAAGRLNRFGFVDPDDGGKVRNGTLGAYYRNESPNGDTFRLDGFLGRSLFDLYSNFTFFLHDEVNGDGIQQHDSRLQDGMNAQYLHPYRLFGHQALLTSGTNFQDNQINLGLYSRVGRTPTGVANKALAHVTNTAGYVQQGMDFLGGRLHLDGGLRFDYFRFGVEDRVNALSSGIQGASRFQPKVNVSFTPSVRIPATVYVNYGRGISSQDARGIVERPEGTKISTTDFYQVGISEHARRLSLTADLFLIDRSSEQVYVPDDGSIEFRGPSRAYGAEFKSSWQITSHWAFNGGLTKVSNAFYRNTLPRIYVDSAPHAVANAGLTLSHWHGLNGSLRFRHIDHYRLDGENPSIRASGLDVLDLSVNKNVTRAVECSVAIDNLTNKTYYETQNYFASRLHPGDPVIARIHGTPGYPITLTVGVAYHFFGK